MEGEAGGGGGGGEPGGKGRGDGWGGRASGGSEKMAAGMCRSAIPFAGLAEMEEQPPGPGPGWRCGVEAALGGEARAEAAAGWQGRAGAQPAVGGMRRGHAWGPLLVGGFQQVPFAPEETDEWPERRARLLVLYI